MKIMAKMMYSNFSNRLLIYYKMMVMKKYLLLSAMLAFVSVGTATECAIKTTKSACCVKKQSIAAADDYYENHNLIFIKYFY
ncbi:MAG: hypothetical protein JWR61_4783 [Ferruginibacter sp.]|nr:hypothetical protein [Ferruginibacter sp.]